MDARSILDDKGKRESLITRIGAPAMPSPEGEGRPGPQEWWTPQEQWIWQQVLAGEVADLNLHYGRSLDPNADYGKSLDHNADGAAWRSSVNPRQVSGRFLLDVLATPAFTEAVPHQGLRIVGAWFPEPQGKAKPLDLSYIVFARQVCLMHCRFECKVWFNWARLESNLLLQGSTFTDVVDLSGVKVGGLLSATGSTFEAGLDMDSLEVGQHLFLGDGATFKDYVSLVSAKVGGGLDLSGATFHRLVDASGAVIDRELRLGSSRHAPSRWEQTASLILRNTSVGALQDFMADMRPDDTIWDDAWPRRLELKGFAYPRLGGGLGEGESDMMDRPVAWYQDWLKRDDSFSPQPYRHLAGVFRAAGADNKTNKILYALREREGAEAWQRREYGKWLGLGLLRAVIGYGIGGGYFRALLWAGLFALAGWLVLWSSDPAFQAHDAVWYAWASLDEIVPLVELNKAHAEFIDSHLQGWRLWYFYGQRIAAYVLGSFVVAGLAGLTQGT
jgi:hypothetical protein